MALVFITGSTDRLGLALRLGRFSITAIKWCLHARSGGSRGDHRLSSAPQSAGIVLGDLRSAAQTRSIADQVNAIGRMDAIITPIAGVYTERSLAARHRRVTPASSQ